MTQPLNQKTGVLLVLRFVIPSIILLFRPTVTFDNGLPIEMGWGKEFVPFSPGHHSVSCFAQGFRGIRTFPPGTVEFDVSEGSVIKLRWTAPVLAWGKGWWKNLGPTDL
jgi:hypothetical protein